MDTVFGMNAGMKYTHARQDQEYRVRAPLARIRSGIENWITSASSQDKVSLALFRKAFKSKGLFGPWWSSGYRAND
jgi:hypothetical protein